MEYLDIVNQDGLPTGEIISRAEAHKTGILHRTAHIWIVKPSSYGYDVLLQKRSDNSESFPGMFDTSSAGHIPAGCEPIQSALRELYEELGITASENQLKYIGKMHISHEDLFHGQEFRDNEITWLYVYNEPLNIDNLLLQETEVSEVRWFDIKKVWNAICTQDEAFCVTKQGLEILMNYSLFMIK